MLLHTAIVPPFFLNVKVTRGPPDAPGGVDDSISVLMVGKPHRQLEASTQAG